MSWLCVKDVVPFSRSNRTENLKKLVESDDEEVIEGEADVHSRNPSEQKTPPKPDDNVFKNWCKTRHSTINYRHLEENISRHQL
jgi:hypothetical protein